jgi:glucan-binding YG repeat protein
MKLIQPSLSSPSAPAVSALALAASTELGLVRSGLVAEYRFNEGSGQVLHDYSGNNNHGTLGSTTGADTNDPAWTPAGSSYDGVDDYVTGAPSATTIQTLMGDGTIAAGMVRGKRTNVKATVYYEGRWSRELTQAEKNNNLAYLKGVVLRRGFTGTVYDWAYPIPCNAGTMDFTITNGQGILWVFPDGTTSTSAHPAKVLASAGTCWLYLTNWGASNLQITDANTNTLYIGSLADLPPLTYYLDLYGCSSVTGSLTDLPPLTYTLSLYGCSSVTGSLADLPQLTYYLDLYSCSSVTGSLADLPPLTYYLSLSGCSLITGDLAELPQLTYYLNLTGCSSVTGSLADLPPLTYYLNLQGCSSVTGDLAELPQLTYTLSLSGCSSVTGDLADLPPLTYYLNLYSCSSVTGSLTDLPQLTYYLNLQGCSLVTGSLADLPPLTNYLNLSGCSSVTGVLSPHTSLKTVNLSGTGLSTANMDQTIINLATNNTQTNGTLTTNGTRSAASDAAVATLRARGWKVDGS